MSTILLSFDSKHVGQEAMHTSVHKSRNQNAVPIYKTKATFPIHKKASYEATRSQFPLTCLCCDNTQMSRADTT